MPSRCRPVTSPVVTRLLISWPRSTLFSSRNDRSWFAVALPFSITVRRSPSLFATVVGEQRQVAGEALDRRGLVDLGGEHGVAVLQQRRGDVEVVVRRRMKESEVSTIRPRSGPVPLNAGAELVDDRGQALLVHRVDRGVEVGQQLGGLDRRPGHRGRDLGPVGEVGVPLGLRLQVDELLADRGPVGHDRLRVGAGCPCGPSRCSGPRRRPCRSASCSLTWPTVTPR